MKIFAISEGIATWGASVRTVEAVERIASFYFDETERLEVRSPFSAGESLAIDTTVRKLEARANALAKEPR